MDSLIEFSAGKALLYSLKAWFLKSVLVLSTLCQIGVVGALLGVAYFAARPLQPYIETLLTRSKWVEKHLAQFIRVEQPLTFPVVALVLLWVAEAIASVWGAPSHVISIGVSLLGVWIVIRLTSKLVRNETWSKLIAASAWILAALNILKLLHPTISLLDNLAVKTGDMRISILTVLKGMILLAVLLRLAMAFSTFLERRIQSVPNLTPSVQVLIGKLLKVTLFTIAISISLGSMGINLTALAVFSGAIGVGVGFGLQKVVSNLVSGIILLLDKSIKPGDVIEIGKTYGWITSLGARYVSLETSDGREYLIPNEDLITQRVVNLSYSNELVRVDVPVGISYDSNVRKAMELAVEAALETERILRTPGPNCLLTGFGESSIDMELRVWINDPRNGVANIKSDLLLGIWDKFRQHAIEIPYPQRDLRVTYSGKAEDSPMAREIPQPGADGVNEITNLARKLAKSESGRLKNGNQ